MRDLACLVGSREDAAHAIDALLARRAVGISRNGQAAPNVVCRTSNVPIGVRYGDKLTCVIVAISCGMAEPVRYACQAPRSVIAVAGGLSKRIGLAGLAPGVVVAVAYAAVIGV